MNALQLLQEKNDSWIAGSHFKWHDQNVASTGSWLNTLSNNVVPFFLYTCVPFPFEHSAINRFWSFRIVIACHWCYTFPMLQWSPCFIQDRIHHIFHDLHWKKFTNVAHIMHTWRLLLLRLAIIPQIANLGILDLPAKNWSNHEASYFWGPFLTHNRRVTRLMEFVNFILKFCYCILLV